MWCPTLAIYCQPAREFPIINQRPRYSRPRSAADMHICASHYQQLLITGKSRQHMPRQHVLMYLQASTNYIGLSLHSGDLLFRWVNNLPGFLFYFKSVTDHSAPSIFFITSTLTKCSLFLLCASLVDVNQQKQRTVEVSRFLLTFCFVVAAYFSSARHASI